MTEQDTAVAVEMALADMGGKMERTLRELSQNWGRGEKRVARDQQALIFGRKLFECGGTFKYTSEHRTKDLRTIWEAMAFDLHDPAATARVKYDSLEEWVPIYKHGCAAFSSALQEQWNDQLIYCIPSTVTGQRIDYVTWNPDLLVDPKGKDGQRTAFEVWSTRGENRVAGQITSVAKKMLRATGRDARLTKISHIATKAVDALPPLLKNGTREQLE